jgi:hypothetical protein
MDQPRLLQGPGVSDGLQVGMDQQRGHEAWKGTLGLRQLPKGIEHVDGTLGIRPEPMLGQEAIVDEQSSGTRTAY